MVGELGAGRCVFILARKIKDEGNATAVKGTYIFTFISLSFYTFLSYWSFIPGQISGHHL